MQSLVDVTEQAKEAGFCCRVAVTGEVWQSCVEWTADDTKRQGYQEQDARLWDVLFVPATRLKMEVTNGHTEQELLKPPGFRFQIYCVLRGKGEDSDLITLRISRKGRGMVITFADEAPLPC